jgi:hypothetical protein
MKKMLAKVADFLKREDGPTAVEYAVMLALRVPAATRHTLATDAPAGPSGPRGVLRSPPPLAPPAASPLRRPHNPAPAATDGRTLKANPPAGR